MCTPRTNAQELAIDLCKTEMKVAKCDEYIKAHPQLVSESKVRNCESLTTCDTSTKLKDYAGACIDNWGKAWADSLEGMGDSALAVGKFLISDTKLSSEIKARETFFENCTSVQCKSAMLGPYTDLFTKEEIEGHPYDKKFFDPRDPAHANFLQGNSAKVLYKKLLERLHDKMLSGNMDQPLLEPWSGKAAKPLLKARDHISQILEKAGVSNTACYDPVVLAQMRCYAFFTMVDPMTATGGVLAIAKVAGVLAKAESVVAKGADYLRTAKLSKPDPHFTQVIQQPPGREFVDIFEKASKDPALKKFDWVEQGHQVALPYEDMTRLLTPTERLSIENYVGPGFIPLNRDLRNGLGCLGDCAKLVAALDKLPAYQGVVFRNVSFPLKESWAQAYLKEGATITEQAFVSTRRGNSTGVPKWSPNWEMRRLIDAGEESAILVIKTRSGRLIENFGGSRESEVMIPPGKKFRVLKTVHVTTDTSWSRDVLFPDGAANTRLRNEYKGHSPYVIFLEEVAP